MMEWQEHFKSVFFDTCKKYELPHYLNFTEAYLQERTRLKFKNDWMQEPNIHSPALNVHLLRSIYGFGVLHGYMFSEFLHLDDVQSTRVADWCGRFNLGISLFDYLCDETLDGFNSVRNLKVFEPFIDTDVVEKSHLTATEFVLNGLAQSVLNDIANSKQLQSLMKALYAAQAYLSKINLTDMCDLNIIKNALFTKSAGPFELMAAYAIELSPEADSMTVKKTQSFAAAVGSCYWLIDDAKDIYVDLEARQWNLLLHMAAQEDATLYAKLYTQSEQGHLTAILHHNQCAEKLSEEVIQSLVSTLDGLGVSQKTKEQTLGMLSASFYYWLL